jgi:hypothetical protein
MGVINDRVNAERVKDEKAITITTKELPSLLTKVSIVDGFFHVVKGIPHMHLITADGEAIVMPVADDYQIGIVSSQGLQETLETLVTDTDNQLEANTAELKGNKEKYLSLLGEGK